MDNEKLNSILSDLSIHSGDSMNQEMLKAKYFNMGYEKALADIRQAIKNNQAIKDEECLF